MKLPKTFIESVEFSHGILHPVEKCVIHIRPLHRYDFSHKIEAYAPRSADATKFAVNESIRYILANYRQKKREIK